MNDEPCRLSDAPTMRAAMESAFGDDGTHPPCAAPDCDEPVLRDVDDFPYEFCAGHMLAVSEPERRAS